MCKLVDHQCPIPLDLVSTRLLAIPGFYYHGFSRRFRECPGQQWKRGQEVTLAHMKAHTRRVWVNCLRNAVRYALNTVFGGVPTLVSKNQEPYNR